MAPNSFLVDLKFPLSFSMQSLMICRSSQLCSSSKNQLRQFLLMVLRLIFKEAVSCQFPFFFAMFNCLVQLQQSIRLNLRLPEPYIACPLLLLYQLQSTDQPSNQVAQKSGKVITCAGTCRIGCPRLAAIFSCYRLAKYQRGITFESVLYDSEMIRSYSLEAVVFYLIRPSRYDFYFFIFSISPCMSSTSLRSAMVAFISQLRYSFKAEMRLCSSLRVESSSIQIQLKIQFEDHKIQTSKALLMVSRLVEFVFMPRAITRVKWLIQLPFDMYLIFLRMDLSMHLDIFRKTCQSFPHKLPTPNCPQNQSKTSTSK